MQLATKQKLKNASISFGAFFLALFALSCKSKNQQTEQWTSESSPSLVAAQPTQDEPANEEKTATAAKAEQQIRFLSYNLKNYLTMRRGKEYKGKPESEIKALIAIIAEQKPHILGVSEIGTTQDLLDLQSRLKAKGIDLPHYEYTGGADKVRHQGLLSRFPIIAKNSQRDLSYELEGQTRIISRGILDATIDTGERKLRFLGVHLKSKRPIEEADQELIRQNEAHLVRNYADSILTEDLESPLFIYGDFNDTIRSKTLSIMKGRSNAKKAMPDFYFKDDSENLWTYFWAREQIYSRIDYILFSKATRPLLVGKESGIVDVPNWQEASDHRGLLLVVQ